VNLAKRRGIAESGAMKTTALLAALLLAACATAPAPSRLPAAVALDDAVRSATVVFYGEAHDDRRQHEYERELLGEIAAAAPPGTPVLVGMEMFQRPFQQPLDDYCAGRIDEKEMLRRTEYFKRWNFDWTFYAPLWRWCREHGGRVVALNAEASITAKIRREGLAKLTPDERSQVAADVDLGNAAHRERILAVLKNHPMQPGQIENYYEAMTVWDETMADSAADALAAAGTGARMLVVAGRGHVEDGTGIPDRLERRRPGLRRAVVVGDTAESVETPAVVHAAGQFVVAFPDREDEPPPRLGIAFDEPPGREGLVVKSVVEGGSAATAGVAAGDVLLRLGDAALYDMTDVRYAVDVAKSGDVVTATGLRDGAPVSFRITLAPLPAGPAQKP
jgi:uncharacterized iron-regulated protein